MGFIGSHLVGLLGTGTHVIDKNRKLRYSKIVYDDLANSSSLGKYDIVYHLAGMSNVKQCEANPDEARRDIVDTTLTILRNFDIKKRLVFASTAAVYGNTNETILTEESELKPISIYAKLKLEAEEEIKRSGVPYTIIRFFNIFGPRQPLDFIIPQLIRQSRLGKIHLRNSMSVRDFLYVRDAVEGLAAVANSERTLNQVVNVCSGEGYAMGHLAKVVCKVLKSSAEITSEEIYDPVSPLSLVGSNTKITALTDWRPRTALSSAIARTAMYY